MEQHGILRRGRQSVSELNSFLRLCLTVWISVLFQQAVILLLQTKIEHLVMPLILYVPFRFSMLGRKQSE